MVSAPWKAEATPTTPTDDDATQYEEVGAWVCKQPGEVTTEQARAEFDKVGNMSSALSRAEKEGIIQRLRRGVYASPDYAPAPVEAPEPSVVEPRAVPVPVEHNLAPAHPELREWLQAGVDAEHITEQQAALLLWRRGA